VLHGAVQLRRLEHGHQDLPLATVQYAGVVPAKVFFTGRKKNSVPSDKYEISKILEISGQI
jgi:hypothetical protein